MNGQLKKIFLFFFSFVIVSNAFAQNDTSFSVSPPPIPWFEFTKGQNDLRIGGFMFSVEDKNNPDMHILGYGGNLIWRNAFTDIIAGDLGLGGFRASGDVTSDTTVSMYDYNVGLNLELQLMKFENVCMILFGGYAANRMEMTTKSGSMSMDGSMAIYGPQAGLQISLKLPGMTISPFILIQRLGGWVQTEVPGYQPTTVDIPSYTQKTIGIDLTHPDWGISLSSMLQLNQNKSKVLFLSFSYDFSWNNYMKTAETSKEE